MYFWSVCFRGQPGFLNSDAICMCVANKQFELLKFVNIISNQLLFCRRKKTIVIYNSTANIIIICYHTACAQQYHRTHHLT